MRKRKKIYEDREKLEETVNAAEDLIALLKQFKVPVDKNIIRRVNEARDHLKETESTRKIRQPGRT
jgi:hypothetical protein